MRYEIFFCTVSMVTLTAFGYWRIVCQLHTQKIKKKNWHPLRLYVTGGKDTPLRPSMASAKHLVTGELSVNWKKKDCSKLTPFWDYMLLGKEALLWGQVWQVHNIWVEDPCLVGR